MLEIDGRRLTQSLAIIVYLDQRFPEPQLVPGDSVDQAHVRAMALTIACDIHPLNNLRVLKYLGGRAGRSTRTGATSGTAHWVDRRLRGARGARRAAVGRASCSATRRPSPTSAWCRRCTTPGASTCRSTLIRRCSAPTPAPMRCRPSPTPTPTSRRRNEPGRRHEPRHGGRQGAGFARDPVARGQGQRRGMGDPRRPRRRLPDGRALRLGRPHLHPFVGAGAGARAPFPAQPVQSDVRGGDRLVAGQGRRARQSGRADPVHHQPRRLHHPFGDPHGARGRAGGDASAHARRPGGVGAQPRGCCR